MSRYDEKKTSPVNNNPYYADRAVWLQEQSISVVGSVVVHCPRAIKAVSAQQKSKILQVITLVAGFIARNGAVECSNEENASAWCLLAYFQYSLLDIAKAKQCAVMAKKYNPQVFQNFKLPGNIPTDAAIVEGIAKLAL